MTTTSPDGRLRPALLAMALAGALTVVAGCSSAAAEFPEHPLPAAFESGVPEPAGDVVLTVTTADDEHDWDLTTLERLPQRDLTILEPFVEEEHTYTGPLWADVLRASGVDLAEAGAAEVVALDDFVAVIPTDPESLDGLLLAHTEDGEEIAVADGGPIRLVFPPDNPTGENRNNWAWSIRTASVQ